MTRVFWTNHRAKLSKTKVIPELYSRNSIENCSYRVKEFVVVQGSLTVHNVMSLGVSIDLVCLAEQPLHTVPLFKFFNKTLGLRDNDIGDDYNIPHWMNHNFYTSPKTRNKPGNVAPRIKIPEAILNSLGKNGEHEEG